MSRYAERQNEYFVPGEGISREVIQADICRYLGNDALVRPGNHNGRAGYFIRAYRNLTSEMIADLRADSARWEQEMSRRADLGYSRVNYSSSNTYEMRQQQQHLQQQQQQQGGPSPQGYNASPVPLYTEQGYGQAGYGVQNPAYQATSAAYPHGAIYQTTQAGYGPAQVAYTQPQQHYGIPGQPAVSSPGPLDQYASYSIHPGGQPAYGHETTRTTAPRYAGPAYDPNEPDYPGVTSASNYPVTTAAERISVEARYTPENYPQDHRPSTTRSQQPRDRDRRGR